MTIPINRLKAVNGSESLPASNCTLPHGCVVTLDSGLPYIAGPSQDIMTVQQLIGAKMDSSGDVWDKCYSFICELRWPCASNLNVIKGCYCLTCYTIMG